MSIYEYYLFYNVFWLSKLCLGLSLFRIRMKLNVMLTIFFIAIPFALISTYIQSLGKIYLISLVQFALGLLFYIFFMRFRWYHGIVIVLIVDILSMTLEVVLNLFFTRFNIQQFWWIALGNDLPIVAIFIILIQIFITFLLYQLRWGFSFVSSSTRLNFRNPHYDKTVIPKMMLCLVLLILHGFVLYFFHTAFLWMHFILNICWVLLLLSAYRFEKSELMSE